MSVSVLVSEARFSYPGASVPAIRDVSVRIGLGEIVVFFGPNGSGKSTLMKAINGLLTTDSGSVTFDPPIVGRDMVYLHQDPYVLDISVRGNIEFPLRARGLGAEERRRRADHWIDRMELGAIADTRARALSGGQKQQVCLARSLVAEPALVLLDEPTAHVDRVVRERFRTILAEEHRRRRMTIVIATHDRGFGFSVGSRFFRFDEGMVQQETVNVLEGSVVDREDHLVRFAVKGGGILVAAEHPGEDLAGACRAVFSGEDILLSGSPIGGSALNQLSTTVAEVECHGGRCRVTLDAGYAIDAIVTERSRDALAIAPGQRLFVALKASGIRLY